MSSWWANRLGQQAPQQRSQAPVAPQRAQAPAAVRVRTSSGETIELDTDSLQEALAASQPPVDGDPHNHKRRMWNWKGNPRGGLGETMKTGECPNCGSLNYFSRATGVTRGPAPAPHCYDCGYPTVQTGSPNGPGASVASKGAGKQAVQAHYTPPAAPGSAPYRGH